MARANLSIFLFVSLIAAIATQMTGMSLVERVDKSQSLLSVGMAKTTWSSTGEAVTSARSLQMQARFLGSGPAEHEREQ